MTDSIRTFATPTAVLAALTAAAAVVLGVSQFIDYSSVALVGFGAEDVADVAPPSVLSSATTGSAHAYAFVPAAVLALAILGFAIAQRRWRLCRLITLIGLAAIVVGFLIDMPKGLDEGDAVRDYEGAEARLLGGFWTQIVAGAVLAISSFLLSGQRSRPKARRSPERQAPEQADAGADRPAVTEGAEA